MAQTTVRFDKDEDLRTGINRACAEQLIKTGKKTSMNQWILQAIKDRLKNEKIK